VKDRDAPDVPRVVRPCLSIRSCPSFFRPSSLSSYPSSPPTHAERVLGLLCSLQFRGWVPLSSVQAVSLHGDSERAFGQLYSLDCVLARNFSVLVSIGFLASVYTLNWMNPSHRIRARPTLAPPLSSVSSTSTFPRSSMMLRDWDFGAPPIVAGSSTCGDGTGGASGDLY
jgi:hypothetical protein